MDDATPANGVLTPEERERREAARVLTRLAIVRGDLVRQPCEVCGEVEVHAHHEDYDRPLEVRWLCQPHHVDRHRETNTGPRGGARAGAGRKRRAGEPTRVIPVRLTASEIAEITAGLYPGETISEVLRDGGLGRIRDRPGGRA